MKGKVTHCRKQCVFMEMLSCHCFFVFFIIVTHGGVDGGNKVSGVQ